MFGMEAGLLPQWYHMTNQIAIKVHTQPGDEVICDQPSQYINMKAAALLITQGASVRLLQKPWPYYCPGVGNPSIRMMFSSLIQTWSSGKHQQQRREVVVMN